MTAKAITFAVQIGSGGYAIAQAVAERVGYRYYDWEVTSEAAREAGVSPEAVAAAEHHQPLVARIMERFLAAGPYVDNFAVPAAGTLDIAIRALTSDDYRRFIEQVVRELGMRGEAVIVGHMSQLVLQQEAGVLKVLVCGSSPRRVERVAADEGLSPEDALAAVSQSDRDRMSFFKRIYHVDLLDARLYDISLNTDELSANSATDLVLARAEASSGATAEVATSKRRRQTGGAARKAS